MAESSSSTVSSSSGIQKRKRKVLSIDTKLAILESLSKGVNHAKLAEQYGVGKSTISDIKKSEQKVKEYASTRDNHWSKHIKKGNLIRLKRISLKRPCTCVYSEKKIQGTAISGPLLAEKAAPEVHQKMELDSEFYTLQGMAVEVCKHHVII